MTETRHTSRAHHLALGLIAAGICVFGISVLFGNKSTAALSLPQYIERGIAQASQSQCTIEAQAQQDEVYFVGCGGFF